MNASELVKKSSEVAMTAYVRTCRTKGVEPKTTDEIMPAYKPLLKDGIEEALDSWRELDNGTPNVRDGLDTLTRAILVGVGVDLFTELHGGAA